MAYRMKLYPWMVLVLIFALASLGWSLGQFYQAREYHQQLAKNAPDSPCAICKRSLLRASRHDRQGAGDLCGCGCDG